MRINVDDWHFRPSEGDTLVLDLFLDNGQHALMEVNPMRNPHVVNGTIPEMIVFCESPGERLQPQGTPARWLARPPNPDCPWSRVQLPEALFQQLSSRLVEAPVGHAV